ncbi:formimidoylglutamase [Virgibacillus necropolis]|uniref:Formimidoylglutamase n=1 Tax=Virgibacillus necropolis TaxID=163877 RepID=A0A221MA30_9BACI|nr:formimidoylglutamase [Virgibacillus necropolis]ASN04497.1 formimidoylglutamase [Virgibacillus necropolis]
MYKLPDKELWTGRVDHEEDVNSFRFHQVVKFNDIDKSTKNESAFGIIGFECDEGVRRNKGRVGASSAPREIRKLLSSLPYNIGDNANLIDAGNVVCENDEMEAAQEELGIHITKLLNHSTIPIIIGGGHETLYGHYLGVREFIGPEQSVGIINIDAHFDMRDDSVPSSGTMFRQILEQDTNAGYLCLGIQEFGNTKALFEKANKLNCTHILEEDITSNNYQHTFQTIDEFSDKHDYIMLTLCTDSIIASEAPGVSAPSVFGLEAKVVRNLLRYIISKPNIVSFDISEVNPLVDEGNKTTKLAAHLIAVVMKYFRGCNV